MPIHKRHPELEEYTDVILSRIFKALLGGIALFFSSLVYSGYWLGGMETKVDIMVEEVKDIKNTVLGNYATRLRSAEQSIAELKATVNRKHKAKDED